MMAMSGADTKSAAAIKERFMMDPSPWDVLHALLSLEDVL
jgi:hypothetical protein